MNFACPHCTQSLEIADEWAGHAVHCPNCQQALAVPSAPAPAQGLTTIPEPVVAPEPAAQPVDPLTWLLEHKERAPKEVALQRSATLNIWGNEGEIGNTMAYRYYRLDITANNGAPAWRLLNSACGATAEAPFPCRNL
ncbi:hypothetical protein DB345_11315 [Spartobacteria bacterium LR76]|nr:hypothetical protein DB345_11315 [Spartobacteria bacterium LR76]